MVEMGDRLSTRCLHGLAQRGTALRRALLSLLALSRRAYCLEGQGHFQPKKRLNGHPSENKC